MADTPKRRWLVITTWNVAGGLEKKKAELLAFLTRQKCDVALLQETHLRGNARLRVPGFRVFRDDRSTRGGGTAILVSDRLAAQRIPLPALANIEATAVRLECEDGPLRLVSVYAPPSRTMDTADLEAVFEGGAATIAAGDYNAKHPDWHSRLQSLRGRTLRRWTTENDIAVTGPSTPSHFPYRGSADVLDIALHQNINSVLTARAMHALDSDHLPVVLHLRRCPDSVPSRSIRDYRQADWAKFREKVTDGVKEWETPPVLDSPGAIDEACASVTAIVKGAFDDAVPLKEVRRWNYLALPPHIITDIRAKNRLRRVYQETRCREDKARMNAAKRRVRENIKAFRRETWERKLASLSEGDGSLWRMARALRGAASEEAPMRTQDGVIHSAEGKAEHMASYLEDVFQPAPAAEGIADPLGRPATIPREPKRERQRDEEAPSVSSEDLLRSVKKLKLRKAPGPDGITNEALRNMPISLASVLLLIFNACLSLGHFPSQWKRARVVCIPKPGKSTSKAENFRPISLLDGLGKLFERVILSHLGLITEERNVLPEHQFGFRSEHSTTHQVARLLNFITEGFNRGHSTVGAFFDVSKAFDRVWHEGLLWKLNSFGYPQWIVDIINSWLRERKFQVVWEGAASEQRRIRAGVPQGSVLSPLLFNIFSADMPECSNQNVLAALYADDAALLARSSKQHMAARYLQRAVDDLVEWYRTWRLAINEGKTQTIVFSKGPKEPGEILVGVTEALWKDSVEYLGISLDKRLNMRQHVSKVRTTCVARRRELAAIIDRHVSLKRRITLSNTIIRPSITYAAPAWYGVATDTARHTLDVLDRKNIRAALQIGVMTHNASLWELASSKPVAEVIADQSAAFFERAQASSHAEIRHIDGVEVLPWDIHRRPRAGTGRGDDQPPARGRGWRRRWRPAEH
jgi:retron-type reverse transcriptase